MGKRASASEAAPTAKRLKAGGPDGQSLRQTTLCFVARPLAKVAVQAPKAAEDSGENVKESTPAATTEAEDKAASEAAPVKPLSPEEEAELEARKAQVKALWEPELGEGWFHALEVELRRPSFEQTLQDVEQERLKNSAGIFPPKELVFQAFRHTPLDQVRVVIVGQDPYHGRGQAMGLSFSVPRGVHVPPSLQNMLKEAGCWPAPHGDLTSWAQQGVLLLNSVLTVVETTPLSHEKLGWERFTDAAIRALSRERTGVIFLLWGRYAKAKQNLIDRSKHHILVAGHPSPMSFEKHFKGCGHFKKVNELLQKNGQPEIIWALSP